MVVRSHIDSVERYSRSGHDAVDLCAPDPRSCCSIEGLDSLFGNIKDHIFAESWTCLNLAIGRRLPQQIMRVYNIYTVEGRISAREVEHLVGGGR